MTHAGKVVLELSDETPELLERCLYELRKVGGEGGPGARLADALLADAVDTDPDNSLAGEHTATLVDLAEARLYIAELEGQLALKVSTDGVIRERLDQYPTDV